MGIDGHGRYVEDVWCYQVDAETANACGFLMSVYISEELWEDIDGQPPRVWKESGYDFENRLRRVLKACRFTPSVTRIDKLQACVFMPVGRKNYYGIVAQFDGKRLLIDKCEN